MERLDRHRAAASADIEVVCAERVEAVRSRLFDHDHQAPALLLGGMVERSSRSRAVQEA
jgi:hypothetical protein